MLVSVRDNNVDQALKVLKKKMQREGLLPMPKKIEKPRRPGMGGGTGAGAGAPR